MALSEYTPEKLQRMLADVITNRFPLADVTLLLRAGADPDGPVTRGLRPLHYAAYENSVEVTADTVFTLCNPFYNRFYNRLFEVNVLDDSCNPSSDRARRVNRLTTGCATGWMNCANDASQAALERPSQDVHDVTASQQGGCVDSRRCDAFDRMNIQNVSSTRLSNRLSNRLYECLRHNRLYNWLHTHVSGLYVVPWAFASPPQTTSRSVQPFCTAHHGRIQPTDTQSDLQGPRCICSNRPHLCTLCRRCSLII